MQKFMRLSDYHFPYVILVSTFLQYFEVNLNEELLDMVKPSHEINNGVHNSWEFNCGSDVWWNKLCVSTINKL